MEIIENAAKYLVQLYNETGYECNRQKLQKLIIFAHLQCIFDGDKGFTDKDFITVTPLGLGIKLISDRYYNYNVGNNTFIEKIKINEEPDNLKYSSDARYDACVLSNYYRNVLLNLFKKYGSYSGQNMSNWTKNTALWRDNIQKAKQLNNSYCIPSVNVINFVKELSVGSFTEYIDNLIGIG